MDKAIHKKSWKLIDAFEIFNNASYQDPSKEKWFAPKDSINNWDELEEQKEELLKNKKFLVEIEGEIYVPIHHKKDTTYPHFNKFKKEKGITISQPPCFSVYPNSPAQTVHETKEHKMLKKWMFNRLKENDLELIYVEKNKPRLKKTIKLSELKIDWNNYQIPEPTVKGWKNLRADILLPLKERHIEFGEWITFEIQIQPQTKKKTFERNIKWALNKSSVVWFFGDDFEFDSNFTTIEIKNPSPRLYSYAEGLYYGGKQFVKNLKNKVIEESQLIDFKINEVQQKSMEFIDDVDLKIKEGIIFIDSLERNIENEKEKSLENAKKKFNGYFANKIKEMMGNINEEIIDKVGENFAIRNEEIIKEWIVDIFSEKIQIDVTNKIVSKFDEDSVFKSVKNNISGKIYDKIKNYPMYKQWMEDPPKCNCGGKFNLQCGQYGVWAPCSNKCGEKIAGWQIPKEIKEVLDDDE